MKKVNRKGAKLLLRDVREDELGRLREHINNGYTKVKVVGKRSTVVRESCNCYLQCTPDCPMEFHFMYYDIELSRD